MPIAQGRHGYVTLGGTSYPVYNWQMADPRNLQIPVPMGNSFPTHYAEGLQTTRFVASVLLRRTAAEGMNIAFWNRFMSRAFAGGFDDTTAFTIVAADGKKTYTLANAKAEAFTISVSKGAPVGLQIVCVGPAIPAEADYTPANYNQTFDGSAPVMFDTVSFTGLTGNCYGAEITFANNHKVNAPLDGTKYASAWDAGDISVAATFTFDTRAVAGEPFAAGGPVAMAVAYGAGTRTFSLTSVVPNDDRNTNGQPGQIFKPYHCAVLGSQVGGTVTAPLVIT